MENAGAGGPTLSLLAAKYEQASLVGHLIITFNIISRLKQMSGLVMFENVIDSWAVSSQLPSFLKYRHFLLKKSIRNNSENRNSSIFLKQVYLQLFFFSINNTSVF